MPDPGPARRAGRSILAVLAVAAVVGAALVVLLAHHQRGGGDAAPVAAGPAPHVGQSAPGGQQRPAQRPLVRGARWEQTTQGFRLRVRPSSYGRSHALSAPSRALTEAIAAAGRTRVRLTLTQRQAMTRQLQCHAEFAATKPRWDLESWRPDVSYTSTVLALCNP